MKDTNKLISYIESHTSRAGSTLSRYQNNQIIYSEGASADSLFYIHEGAVRLITRTKNQPSAVTAILGVHDFFGELCLVGFPHRVSTAIALTASSIQVIEKKSMIRVLRENNEMSNSFVSYLLSSIRQYQDSVAELLTSSSEQRLARVLLRLANLDTRDPLSAELLTPSDQVLAEMVGTTRPRVNFFMNRFRKRRYISSKARIEVRESLQQVLRRGRGVAPSRPPIIGGSRHFDPHGSKLAEVIHISEGHPSKAQFANSESQLDGTGSQTPGRLSYRQPNQRQH
jgi:CRP/FNR family transcriptional regulator, cyclic AMP receptor protein